MMFRRKQNQIAFHVAEITRIMTETAPEGAEVTGFQFKVQDGEPHAIWGSARVGSSLAHMRPGVFPGWRVKKLELVS